jgi:hypothetical protein
VRSIVGIAIYTTPILIRILAYKITHNGLKPTSYILDFREGVSYGMQNPLIIAKRCSPPRRAYIKERLHSWLLG